MRRFFTSVSISVTLLVSCQSPTPQPTVSPSDSASLSIIDSSHSANQLVFGDPDTLFSIGGLLDTSIQTNDLQDANDDMRFVLDSLDMPFSLIIHNWGARIIEDEWEHQKIDYLQPFDSIFLEENVFNSLSERIIQIVDTIPNSSYQVSLLVNERVTLLNKNEHLWTGNEGYIPLRQPYPNWFVVPSFYPEFEQHRKAILQMGDTMVGGRGEMAPMATLAKNGRPYWYKLQDGYLKIERLINGNVASTTYVFIYFAWGC